MSTVDAAWAALSKAADAARDRRIVSLFDAEPDRLAHLTLAAAGLELDLSKHPWSLADLGVDAGEVGLSVAYSQVESTEARPPRTAGEIVTDEDGSGAGALVEFLASKKFI